MSVLNPSSDPGQRISAIGRMRLATLRLRAEMIGRIQQQGFSDVGFAQIVLFRNEGLDGRQPSEIAASSGLSKQSVNDGLRELEALGYVTRKPHPHDGRARIVRLTARGRRLDGAIMTTGKQLESEWHERVGHESWEHFVSVLDEMTQGRPSAHSAGSSS